LEQPRSTFQSNFLTSLLASCALFIIIIIYLGSRRLEKKHAATRRDRAEIRLALLFTVGHDMLMMFTSVA